MPFSYRCLVRHGIFLSVSLVPGFAGGSGQVHVDVGHSWHDGSAALIDDDRAGERQRSRAGKQILEHEFPLTPEETLA